MTTKIEIRETYTKVHVFHDSKIGEVLIECLAIANVMKHNIVFDFNGIEIIVFPNMTQSDLDDLDKNYRKRIRTIKPNV